MEKRILDYDPELGRTRYFHSDATGDEFVVESVYDVTDVIEANKAEYAQTDEHAKWGELQRVGSIPMHIYMQLIAEKKIDGDGTCHDPQQLLKWLSDRDNLAFRTRPGRLI